MSAVGEQIRRFGRRHIVNHLVMLVCFLGLVLTGLPQKYAGEMWAKGIVLVIGGVERVRFIHHILGTLMALQLVWHAIEAGWLHLVRRNAMPMVPLLDDVKNLMQQIKFNLGLEKRPPRMDRYTFAEKLEYLALVWGTVVMVLTGLVLLYPVRWTSLFPGEVVLAAKAAHGGEAILAFLSILTWHFYFVHVRHWNTSMFTGKLGAEEYAEEHPLELARLRRGEETAPAPLRAWRVGVFLVFTLILVLGSVFLVAWLRGSVAGIEAFKAAGTS
ncbi:MAG: cytochrome C [Thermoanaerobaculaceae bacterium]|jgi:cytochrome b subunit of formate dehydrogenase